MEEMKMAKKTKDYDVDVYSASSHGRYGKDHYFRWCLNDTSIENVKLFAIEILAGMTYKEVFGDDSCLYGMKKIANADGTFRLKTPSADEILGYEVAESRFTIKAKVLK